MPLDQPSVASFLTASPQAQQRGHIDLGFDRQASLWHNSDDRISYVAPEGHCLSFYAQGGMGTRRIDGAPVHGWAGAVCILPHGMDSEWEITDPFDFVHLYLSDAELRRAFAETFDCDARLMELTDETYFDAPWLAGHFLTIQQATQSGNPVQAEEAVSELVHGIFAEGIGVTRRKRQLVGGLAPHLMRRIRDFVRADLSAKVTLSDLAQLCDLSEFHLQRSFRASLGLSPHEWIQRQRLEEAKRLIAAGEPLAQIASSCGFSSQSHLSRSFKAQMGMTPGAYGCLI
ncbi:Multiple antibiotic resistance protein MarA [Thalassovita autumnalis]|uniref:Multiple antibiotic resistance protein MarA n=1 Tax=Thalassovita autumnalis TaxID=2072972 RepID=A0A0P1FWW8_9RHOB|nr:AraC family transcriptional regulator [Thalassovita autumnalis]CUH68386.1 Multiple antibiotic resistance protein MarA [Thalassovita autumnalis]CUH73489.1 Multiple antibiotic resistance protein MarA [Thalassovita autumnalis]